MWSVRRRLKLLVKEAVDGGGVAHEILRQLGGDVYLVTNSVALEHLAQQLLGARIHEGRVKVVDAQLNGAQQLPLGLVIVDARPLAREAHASIAKDGELGFHSGRCGTSWPILSLGRA